MKILPECLKCNNINYEVKTVRLITEDCGKKKFNILSNREIYYFKVCMECGYTEVYNAKLVDEYVAKNPKRT